MNDELIWVIAGSYHDYINHIRGKVNPNSNHNYVYILNAKDIQGRRNIKVEYGPNWNLREDIEELEDEITNANRSFKQG